MFNPLSKGLGPQARHRSFARRTWPSYAAIRRWHFYAGILSIPFVLWLSLTGSIYLFRPQIEALIDAPYAHVARGARRATAAEEVAAATRAVPGSVLDEYQLPDTPDAAVQILVGKGAAQSRVYIDPSNLRILKLVDEDSRLMPMIFRLHGELLMGDRGSYIVEIAASWAIVMILSGLFLWWPRGARLAGVLYPRFGTRQIWRDLHAVTGFWASILALFFLVSGLPWAKSWGAYLAEVRSIAASRAIVSRWAPAGSDVLSIRKDVDHAERAALTLPGAMPGMAMSMGPTRPVEYGPIDRIIAAARPIGLSWPVLIAPPMTAGGPWTASSEAQNVPMQATVTIDGVDGRVLSREDFKDRPMVDQIVGYGIAAHEGQLFGALNQLINLFLAASLVLVCVSGTVLWWRRRPQGMLGAPAHRRQPPLAWLFFGTVSMLAILLPLFGLSLLAVLALERLLLRRIDRLATWLGLPAVRGERVIATLPPVATS